MLRYPYTAAELPAPGGWRQINEGVFWLRMPLPLQLDHINLWLLKDGDGWTLVDTGIYHPDTIEHWQRLVDSLLQGKPLRRLLVTHMHPDHVGMAGWLAQRLGAELWMTEPEYRGAVGFADGSARPPPEAVSGFYHAAGMTADQLSKYRQESGKFRDLTGPVPESYQPIKAGDQIAIDGRSWQVVTGCGHSPQHACFYSPDYQVLISGDQVLPRITSNISVTVAAPDANPLDDWIKSCQSLRAALPDDLLVLPAHQEPFFGLHRRLEDLVVFHQEALARLLAHLATPSTAMQCIPVMFRREITDDLVQLAIAETLAHLNYLLHSGRIERTTGNDGVNIYCAIS